MGVQNVLLPLMPHSKSPSCLKADIDCNFVLDPGEECISCSPKSPLKVTYSALKALSSNSLVSLSVLLVLLSSKPARRSTLLLTNGPALSSWFCCSRLISQSMGIFRGAPPTFATCPSPSSPCTPAHCVIQPSIQPSVHKMTLELTEWSSIWIFTACNRQ